MNLRQLIQRLRSEARDALGQQSGVVYEAHVNPDNEAEVSTFGPTPLKSFLSDWGTDLYMGDFQLPYSAMRQQYIGVVHSDGVLLVQLEGRR